MSNHVRNDTKLFFDAVCGADNPFWDLNLSWHTSTPDLTLCLIKIVPVWIPAAVLCVVASLVRFTEYNARSRKRGRGANRKTKDVDDQKTNDIDLQNSMQYPSEEHAEIPRLTVWDFVTRWRRWSSLFLLKLFAISSLVFLAFFGKLDRLAS